MALIRVVWAAVALSAIEIQQVDSARLTPHAARSFTLRGAHARRPLLAARRTDIRGGFAEAQADEDGRLSVGAKSCIFAVQFSEAVQSMMLFPFLPFMVEGFGIPASKLGAYTGLLSSSYCFASFIATPMVSACSDFFGVRQTMLFTITIGILATALFGTSTSFSAALVARIVAGSMNGNISILKAYIARTTSGQRRVRAFGLLTLAFGFGAVIAPVTGGLLARPASNYPGLFGGMPVFAAAPYLLPCLACMVVQLAALLTTYVALREPARAPGAASEEAAPRAPTVAERLSFIGKRGPMLACLAYALDCFVNVLYDLAVPLLLKLPLSEGGVGLSMREIGFLMSAASIGLFGSLPLQAPLTQRIGTKVPRAAARAPRLRASAACVCARARSRRACGAPRAAARSPRPRAPRRPPPAQRSLAWANFLLLPVFCVLPALAVLRRVALTPGAPPVLARLVFPMLFLTLASINCFGTLGFTLGNVIVNNSVQPSQLAMINGFSQSLSALARGFAPLVGGLIVTIGCELALPGRQFLVFAFMGIITFACGWVVRALPPPPDAKNA